MQDNKLDCTPYIQARPLADTIDANLVIAAARDLLNSPYLVEYIKKIHLHQHADLATITVANHEPTAVVLLYAKQQASIQALTGILNLPALAEQHLAAQNFVQSEE